MITNVGYPQRRRALPDCVLDKDLVQGHQSDIDVVDIECHRCHTATTKTRNPNLPTLIKF